MDSLVGWYAVGVCVLVVGMWSASLVMHRVPEIETAPREITMHLAAEGLMAATLLAGGVGVLAGAAGGPSLLMLGFGLTLYSVVTSSGYCLQRRVWPPVLMFSILFVLTLVAALVTAG